MAEREKEADADRAFALLHQLAGDIVDGRDVIGVHGVAQAEAVSQQCRTEQHRFVAKHTQGPRPDADIANGKQRVDTSDSPTQIDGTLIENLPEWCHRGAFMTGLNSLSNQTKAVSRSGTGVRRIIVLSIVMDEVFQVRG